MKIPAPVKRHLPPLVLALYILLLAACGYYNPNVLPDVRDLPPTKLYAPMWTNATSEFGLENRAYNSISDWLIQSGRVVLVASEAEADFILTGRIAAVSYPGFSYDAASAARSLKAVMTAALEIREKASGKVLWQTSSLRLEETYNLGGSAAQTDRNKRETLDLLVEDLGEQVYLRLFRVLASHHRRGQP